MKLLVDRKSLAFKQKNLGLITDAVYNPIRNKVNQTIRSAQINYYNSAFHQTSNNMKKNWKILKNILGTTKTKNDFDKVIVHNLVYTDPTDIANCFNEYFCSIATELAENLPAVPESETSNMHTINNSIFMSLCSVNEIEKIIRKLKITTTELNSIPVKVFKQISPIIAPVICLLINLSITKGIFPDILKIARITPILKKGEKHFCGNYRPIASLPILSKIYERVIANRLIGFMDKYSIINRAQFGFLRGKSTSDAIHYLIDFIHNNLDNKRCVINVQVDLKKAFDTVNHEILMKKLYNYGIRGTPSDLLKSYLSNRKQFVRIKNCPSELKHISNGVPQGSILGPILFLFFINDLPLCSNILMPTLYADDTTFSIAHNDPEIAATLLNFELSKFHKWTIENRLSINFEKTEMMLFINRRTNIPELEVNFGGVDLQFTECATFLGLKLDDKLKFTDHIEHIVGKLSKNIGIFSKIKYKLPLKSRINYYYCFIYSYLTYNIIIWGKTYACHLEPLIVLQKRMIRLMKDAEFLSHTTPLFHELRILKFNDIYSYFTSIFMYKAIKIGLYCTEHTVNTRNRNDARPVNCNTTLRQQSLSYMGPKTWNKLPNEIRSIQKLSTFKNSLKKHFISCYEQSD